jgi:hypothetical protein
LSDCKAIEGETVARKRMKVSESVALSMAISRDEAEKEADVMMQMDSKTNNSHVEASSSRLDPHAYYELIGECYIHGLMNREDLALGKAEQWFELR